LHWIKTDHISCTTRLVNSLGCGVAVREYSELAGAEIILVKAPDVLLPELLREMAACRMNWKNRTVIAFDTDLDSYALAPLEKLGAFAASVARLHDIPHTLFAEGHPNAMRSVRRLLRGHSGQLIEIRRGGKADYLAGVRMGTSAFLPTVATAVDHFVRAGIQKTAAEKTAASLFEASIRAYFRAGKRLLRRSPHH
jgi:hypothetical protein